LRFAALRLARCRRVIGGSFRQAQIHPIGQ